MSMLLLWVVIGVAGLVVDLVTSAFLFVWFTLGAIAALIGYSTGASELIQCLIFLTVSAITMGIGYPLVKKLIKKSVPKVETMEEGYIGRELIISEEVIEKAIIKFEGIYWTVKNMGTPIRKGDKVQIIGLEGNKLLIKKI